MKAVKGDIAAWEENTTWCPSFLFAFGEADQTNIWVLQHQQKGKLHQHVEG